VLFFFLVIVLPLFIFAIVYRQCFWSNFITAVNIVLCSTISFNYAQLLSDSIYEYSEKWAAFWEFAFIWITFCLALLISKTICNLISKYPVRFGKKIDGYADFFGCFCCTIVMYCWICFTLFASAIGSEGFQGQLISGVPGLAGQYYGIVVFEFPSKLGMAGSEFDFNEWSKTRLQRSADEINQP